MVDRLVGLLQSVVQSPNSSGVLRKVFDENADPIGRGQHESPQFNYASLDPTTVSPSSSGAVDTDTGGVLAPTLSIAVTSPVMSEQASDARGALTRGFRMPCSNSKKAGRRVIYILLFHTIHVYAVAL